MQPPPAALLSAGDAAYRQAIQKAKGEGRKAKLSRDRQGAKGADADSPTHQLTNLPTSSQSVTNPSQPASRQGGKQVALARFRLAYVYAQRKQYEKAIATFQELLDHYTGPPQRDPQTVATLPERARYQIACCYRGLMREARRQSNQSTGTSGQSTANPVSRNAAFYRQKAIEEFTRFLGQCPTSPLAHTAARAIADLNGGKLPKRAGALYAHALRLEEKQRKEEQRQRAMCGPEALRWVLAWVKGRGGASLPAHRGSPIPSVEELAQACGTSERGTTLFDLARVARQYGLRVSGVQATWEWLQQITPPAIMLLGGHYVVLTRVDKRGIYIVDPSRGRVRRGGETPAEPAGSAGASPSPAEEFLSSEQFQPPWEGYLLVIHGRRQP